MLLLLCSLDMTFLFSPDREMYYRTKRFQYGVYNIDVTHKRRNIAHLLGIFCEGGSNARIQEIVAMIEGHDPTQDVERVLNAFQQLGPYRFDESGISSTIVFLLTGSGAPGAGGSGRHGGLSVLCMYVPVKLFFVLV